MNPCKWKICRIYIEKYLPNCNCLPWVQSDATGLQKSQIGSLQNICQLANCMHRKWGVGNWAKYIANGLFSIVCYLHLYKFYVNFMCKKKKKVTLYTEYIQRAIGYICSVDLHLVSRASLGRENSVSHQTHHTATSVSLIHDPEWVIVHLYTYVTSCKDFWVI